MMVDDVPKGYRDRIQKQLSNLLGRGYHSDRWSVVIWRDAICLGGWRVEEETAAGMDLGYC